MKQEVVSVWVAADDKRFFTKHECALHDLRVRLTKWADQRGICREGEWSQEMVTNALFDDRLMLASILEDACKL